MKEMKLTQGQVALVDETEEKPLWSNLDITRAIIQNEVVGSYIPSPKVRTLLENMREDFKKKIAELEDKVMVMAKELTSTSNADRYYRGFNAGYDEAQRQGRLPHD